MSSAVGGHPGQGGRFSGHASKPSNSETGFSHGAFASNVSGFADRHPRRANHIPTINTQGMNQSLGQAAHGSDMTPGTGMDLQFTPLLPSQLLLGSPFQPGSPTAFASPQFQFQHQQQQHAQHAQHQHQLQLQLQQQQQQQQQGGQGGHLGQQLNGLASPTQGAMSPQAYQAMVSPSAYGVPHFFPQSPTAAGFGALQMQQVQQVQQQHQQQHQQAVQQPPLSPVPMTPGMASSGTSRTVYLGNIPPDTSAEEILGHVRSGQIESVRLLPDKNCAFISFLDASSATHFHSDAILKKLCIKGQDIKVGWGKPSQVPTSVAVAVQQSGASRNVYLGNLSEDTTEDEIREDLAKFGAIDTIKLVREKNIAFVHYLSIANAVKAVSQLPQEAKWQAPRRVFYGKDRCAYVSKTQQQNAAQYLGIAPGHMLSGADRDMISSALAQQSMQAAAVATTSGGINNVGNRTIYLGNIHPETTIEEICNVVRGGLLHHIRYIPDKHICFVTFIDPTASASFFALSSLQGLMIHNRRLKIGWGKHSGGLPPAIALAVSGGASRNVYIGNLDETWTEDRLRQDFSEYGEIELVNTLREKSCAFVNFTNIANAIKAIEAIRGKDEYKKFKVNFGKDRCGNPPRQLQSQSPRPDGGLTSPSMMVSPTQTGSPTGGMAANGAGSGAGSGSGTPQPQSAGGAGSSGSGGPGNPLSMYLSHVTQQAQQQQVHTHHHHQQQLSLQQQNQHNALYGSPAPSPIDLGLGDGSSPHMSSHHHHPHHHHHQQSASISTNDYLPPPSSATTATAPTTIGGLLAPGSGRGQHSRAVSLPVLAPFEGGPVGSGNGGLHGGGGHHEPGERRGHHYQASYGGMGAGLGLGLQGGLNGWVEEEVSN
jgi:RNA recognition motif-containing protein